MSLLSSKKFRILGTSFLVAFVGISLNCCQQQKQVVVPSILGTEDLSDLLLQELYTSDALQRLKKIDQSGPSRYFGKIKPFSRFSHSIGVWSLLKRHNCSLAEQAAGLMHDVSHTAFSHLGDYIFSSNIYTAVTQASYQDDIHLEYLKKHHIDAIAKRHNLRIEDLNPDNKLYVALEQPLPNLCADRIEYILHTALVTNDLTKNEVKEILSDLNFDGAHWFLTKPELARKIANLSLRYTRKFWGSAWNIKLNIHFAEIIKRCFSLKVLTSDDLFLADQDVLQKIQTYQNKKHDPLIQLYWKQCERINEDLPGIQYKVIKIQPKFRGVDPLVKTKDGLVRLTTIDSDYKQDFMATKKWSQTCVEVKVIVPPGDL